MKLYFRDTPMSYSEISNLLTSHIGSSGPDTWQNNAASDDEGFRGYIEIYNNHPGAVFVKLKW
jgi:hypothetical protein